MINASIPPHAGAAPRDGDLPSHTRILLRPIRSKKAHRSSTYDCAGLKRLCRGRDCTVKRSFWLILAFFAFTSESLAQLPGTVGVQPFEAQHNEVSVDTLNVHLDIPVVSKAGIGLAFKYALSYNNNFWTVINTGSSKYWLPGPNSGGRWAGGGWSFNQEYGSLPLVGYSQTVQVSPPIAQCPIDQVTGYLEPNGTTHDLSGYNLTFNAGSPPNCTPTSVSFLLQDGSGLTINVGGTGTNANSALTRGGDLFDGTHNEITDTNRNTIYETFQTGVQNFVDTLGVTALSLSGYGTKASPSNPYVLTYPTANASATVTINFAPYTVQSNFGCSGVSEYPAQAASLVDNITYSGDGSKYSFTYEVTPGDTHTPHYITNPENVCDLRRFLGCMALGSNGCDLSCGRGELGKVGS